MAVGMAMAEAHLAAVFNKPEYPVVDHYTFVLGGDGCMMEGISSEAFSLAGTLGLSKLIVLYDSNNISIEGGTDIAFTENVQERMQPSASRRWKLPTATIWKLSAKLLKSESRYGTSVLHYDSYPDRLRLPGEAGQGFGSRLAIGRRKHRRHEGKPRLAKHGTVLCSRRSLRSLRRTEQKGRSGRRCLERLVC